MNDKDWQELVRLRDLSLGRLPQVCTRDLERFSELFVQSLEGKGDPPIMPTELQNTFDQ